MLREGQHSAASMSIASGYPSVELHLDDDGASVVAGTFVDLEASVRSASVADVAFLHTPLELKYEDMEAIANKVQGASKLAGSGWKRPAAHPHDLYASPMSPKQPTMTSYSKTMTKSVLDDDTLYECLNLQDALRRFDLDNDGKLDEREQTALYRTYVRDQCHFRMIAHVS